MYMGEFIVNIKSSCLSGPSFSKIIHTLRSLTSSDDGRRVSTEIGTAKFFFHRHPTGLLDQMDSIRVKYGQRSKTRVYRTKSSIIYQ